jgi:hypothetical protein
MSFDAGPFPAEPTWVRVAFETMAAQVEEGHWLAVLVTGSDVFYRAGNAFLPTLTLASGSHVDSR